VAVLGVDISTHKLSFILVGADESVCWRYEGEAAGRLSADRFPMLVTHAAFALNTWYGHPTGAACRVVIEGLPYVRSRDGIVGLGKVLGMVEGLARHFGYEVEVVDGHDWKRALGLSGIANKETVAKFAGREGFGGNSQDLVDAFCIALAGVRKDNEDD
jgi:hypothetical protein